MNKETKSALLQFDERGRFETPSEFNHAKLKNRVIKLTEDLRTHFGFGFRIDDQVQDASFYGDILIPVELIKEPKQDVGYSIRISNYGSFATINFQDEYSVQTNSDIRDILRKHDFLFLDSAQLDEVYDGQFEEFKKILGGVLPTWYIRYFDYL